MEDCYDYVAVLFFNNKVFINRQKLLFFIKGFFAGVVGIYRRNIGDCKIKS